MQSGAYNKVSRTLIEIGVPRECALYLNNEFLKDYVVKDKSDTEIEEELREILIRSKDKLPYWIGVQLDFLGKPLIPTSNQRWENFYLYQKFFKTLLNKRTFVLYNVVTIKNTI